MNAEWSVFLARVGAVLASNQVASFGQPDRELQQALTDDICCDLSHQGVMAARGPDSETFLQGQFTCDVRHVTAEHSLIGAYCTPKGRALACCRIFLHDQIHYLELPRSLLEPTLTRLRNYVMRAKTVLEDASDRMGRMGVAGPQTARLLSHHGLIVDETMVPDAVQQTNHLTLIRLPGPIPRFEIHGPAQQLAEVWQALSTSVAPVGAEAWRLLDILAGMPVVYPETVEAFVPQMLNLESLDGISFQKGCYTGQEIVARAHYLGKLKRGMVLARVDSPTPPHPGDSLFSSPAGSNQNAGQLVNAARHPDGGYAVLAVVLLEIANEGVLYLGDASGPPLRLEPLPYSVATTR